MWKSSALILVLYLSSFALFAGGSSELPETSPGEGVLAIYTKTSGTSSVRFTIRGVFNNSRDGSLHRIDLSNREEVSLYKLPVGDYFLEDDAVLKEGRIDTEPDNGRFPNVSFSISEGEITPLPFMLHYFDTKRDHPASNDVPLPEEFRGLEEVRRFYTDGSVQSRFFALNPALEKELVNELSQMEGFSQWRYAGLLQDTQSGPESTATMPGQTLIWEPPPLPQRNAKILSIGIDEYADPTMNLNSAAAGAKRVASLFDTRFDSEGTNRNDLLDTIRSVSSTIGNGETLVIYIAGHAVSDIKGRPYIVPSDGSISSMQSSCIPLRRLFSVVEPEGARVLFILDVGRSGPWTDGREALFSLNRDTIEEEVQRVDDDCGVLFLYDDSAPDVTRGAELLANEKLDYSRLFQEEYWRGILGEAFPELIWHTEGAVDNDLGRVDLEKLTALVNDRQWNAADTLLMELAAADRLQTVYLHALKLSINRYRGRLKTPPGFAYVESGNFLLGEGSADDSIRPVEIHISRDFLISEHEVTQQEYEAIMGHNPATQRRGLGPEYPVYMVNWYDALEYCNRRSVSEGLTPCYEITGYEVFWDKEAEGYRLPTEAEWEYAARGGGLVLKPAFYAGGQDLDAVGWYEGNANGGTNPVKQKEPNRLGIYDMSGNVAEWCWDWYAPYPEEAQTDYEGPLRGQLKVQRGGNWLSNADSCTVQKRIFSSFSRRNSSTDGFRVVRTVLFGGNDTTEIDGEYTGAADSMIDKMRSREVFAYADWIKTEIDNSFRGDEQQILMRFSDIFDFERVPLGSAILSAELQVYVTDGSKAEASIHRLLTPWDEEHSWHTIGDGISLDNIEAVRNPDDAVLCSESDARYSFDVSASVNEWSINRDNFGWVIILPDADGLTIHSSEQSDPEKRPTLLVQYAHRGQRYEVRFTQGTLIERKELE